MPATEAAAAFCRRFGLSVPILEAPMAGACPPGRAAAIAGAGGMGAMGALLTPAPGISDWVVAFRGIGGGPLQINVWIPDPAPIRDRDHEVNLRAFLSGWGPSVSEDAGDGGPPNFADQCEAIVQARPTAVSSIMGLFDPGYVTRLKDAGIAWFATATTLAEAKAAEAAGADAIIAQGVEAGGHRGTFDPVAARTNGIGLMAFLPILSDRLSVPIIATGGIADGRGVAAALTLGASAAMIGTAFLRCPESDTPPAWSEALSRTDPEGTMITRAFSGRPGRSIATDYAKAAAGPDAPEPAPYPVQRGLTAALRAEAVKDGDVQRMQAWSGQAALLARSEPAAVMVRRIWEEAEALLPTDSD
jgi:nitronate monooxygenase